MKLFTLFRSVSLAVFSASLVFSAATSLAATTGRQAVKLPDAASAANAVARGTAFVLNGAVFTSKQAYIDSGARCGTVSPGAEKLAAWEQQARVLTQQRIASGAFVGERPTGSVVVPTVVHVINKGAGIANGDVPQAWIAAQIQVLNDAYVASPFRFNLIATTRTTNAAWYDMAGEAAELAAKTALHQGGPETLNIYVSDLSGGLLGYAYYASDAAAVGVLDGVVILNQSLPGGGASPYNLGDTATHEVGHWFGLAHTFEGGCSRSNDLVADTAPEASPAFGCPIGRNSCRVTRSGDPIFNFMDYTDDSCMDNFTRGQSVRMDEQHLLYRTVMPVASRR